MLVCVLTQFYRAPVEWRIKNRGMRNSGGGSIPHRKKTQEKINAKTTHGENPPEELWPCAELRFDLGAGYKGR